MLGAIRKNGAICSNSTPGALFWYLFSECRLLRMYCIDVRGLPESSDACTFDGSHYSCILVEVPLTPLNANPGVNWMISGPARAASIKHKCYGSAIYAVYP